LSQTGAEAWEEVSAIGRMPTEERWSLIAPLLPPQRPRGRKEADDRQALEGVLWAPRTGPRWQDLPGDAGARPAATGGLGGGKGRGWERAFLPTLDEAGKLPWGRAFLDGALVPARRGEEVGPTRRGKGSEVVPVMGGTGPPPGGAGGGGPEGGRGAGGSHPGPGEAAKAPAPGEACPPRAP